MWIFNKYHDKYGGENMKSTKLSMRVWISLIVFGLFGQLAWTVENMYFNVYVYNTITGNTTVIASMVAFSALTATLTTLFMGALSDKAGKRKVFICAGGECRCGCRNSGCDYGLCDDVFWLHGK